MGYVMLGRVLTRGFGEIQKIRSVAPIWVNTDNIISFEESKTETIIDDRGYKVDATSIFLQGGVTLVVKGRPEEVVKAIEEASC